MAAVDDAGLREGDEAGNNNVGLDGRKSSPACIRKSIARARARTVICSLQIVRQGRPDSDNFKGTLCEGLPRSARPGNEE